MKKLKLNRQSIRNLTGHQLYAVRGGGGTASPRAGPATR